jgi:basic amino acid/polyamine antiporter, APA family
VKKIVLGRSEERLKRSVHLIDVVMLGAGSALGVSIFSVLSPAAAIGGSGILLTIGISALPMAIFALAYSFLASAVPRSGASFEWPFEFIHPLAGYLVSWLRILGQVGQMVMVTGVLIHYVGMVVPLPLKLTMFLLFAAVFTLNFIGVTVVARTQTVMMIVLISVFAIYVVTGLPHVDPSRIYPLAAHGIWPILLAAPLMVNLFMGIEAATEIGEEVRNAERSVPLAIAISLLLIAIVYFSVTFVTLGLLGPTRLGQSDAPLVDAARLSIGSLAIPLILGAATVSLLKSLNASFLIFSRSLFAMGRAGVLPRILGTSEPVRGTPRWAVTIAFVCLCFGLLLPNSLIFLFLASNIPTILKYLSTCCCVISVVGFHQDTYASARFRPRKSLLLVIAAIGVLMAIGLFVLGYESDWKPYALVGGWGLVGLVYWFGWRRSRFYALSSNLSSLRIET